MSGDQETSRAEAVRAGLERDVVEFSPASIYEWGPVYRARLTTADGREADAVVKPTLSDPGQAAALGRWQTHLHNAGFPCVRPLTLAATELPVHAAETAWMAYPWIEGTVWPGTTAFIMAAGRGLGIFHRESFTFDDAGLPRFEWPKFSAESVSEDVEAIQQVCREHAQSLEGGDYPLGAAEAASRWVGELEAFHSEPLPAIRDAGLPSCAVSLDYRASNLIYADESQIPTFIDFENGEVAPRLLDLALSVLLFASEAKNNPGRLFSSEEWKAYLAGYVAEAPPLTADETELWPAALKYMRLEWGTWQLTEGAEWHLPGQQEFLLDLLTVQDAERFPLRT
ncbi:Ser/Thr protein kinase RdoA (MazF antagonist) [Arthrobacter pigmenti]|uniref:Ser/Thr protein kinase RdoA (MazF antagonist) n=1 Tax=Arthrobacter pigmenti TaxID=271432 RepID=A0A846RV21_9MICC|nr:Ser/Thr protein kinase RdoA (MazF antagonist) [Arthrobacter pigmenti]